MSQMYTIVSIVGFSLAGVLAVAALVMFFALRIRQVRDDLTGKTAARSIAEIRSRAKTRKRSTADAAKRLGWGQDVSSGALAQFAMEDTEHPTTDLSDFDDDDEGSTTMFNAAPAVAGDDDDDDEGFTTELKKPASALRQGGTR